jgi:CrcB protein
MNILYVALVGAMGAAARYLAGLWIVARAGASFPWGIFFVNVTASLLIGIVLVLVEAGTLPAEPL